MRIISKLLFSAAFVAVLSCVATAQEATAQSEDALTPTSLRRALVYICRKCNSANTLNLPPIESDKPIVSDSSSLLYLLKENQKAQIFDKKSFSIEK
jgi:hypothetical protein